MKNWVKPAWVRVTGLLGLDSAISFDLLARVWSLGSGPVTSALIILHFTPEVQGYYFTFLSLAGMVALLDLGGVTPAINLFLSHEWSRLRLGPDRRVTGDPDARSRLISIGRFSLFWHAAWAPAVLIGLSLGGYFFLAGTPNAGIAWKQPWIALCLLATADLGSKVVLSLLEGTNQIGRANVIRLIRAVSSSLVLWTAIILGAQLWANPLATAVGITVFVAAAYTFNRRFLSTFLQRPEGSQVSWRKELAPLQWRFALAGITTFITYGLFIPMMYYFHGPETAGRAGFTWTVVQAVITVSAAWVNTKAPQFGMLAAARDRTGLDRLAKRSGAYVVVLGLLGSATLLGAVAILQHLAPGIAGRMLPLGPTALLLAGGMLANANGVMHIYMRAHKQEPLLALIIIGSIFTLASMAGLGKLYGPAGSAGAYAGVQALWILPGATFILIRFRRRMYPVSGPFNGHCMTSGIFKRL